MKLARLAFEFEQRAQAVAQHNAGESEVLDASLLVDIQRTQSWIVRHLDQILRSDSQRYRDDEFERALREYAEKVGLSDALDECLVSASQWRW